LSTRDHNETLVGIHFAVGLFFAFGLVASPWIIAQNFRHKEQIPAAVLIFGIVFCVSLMMFTTAFAMRRKKPFGRKLALWSAAVLIIIFWPAGIYSWWFLHSEGAKQMYGVKDE
jgi:heme/copper-type cytochrome/quinol oxidase subunit 3